VTHQGLSSIAAGYDAHDNPSPKILVPFTDYFKESKFLDKDILHKQEKILAISNLMDGGAKVCRIRTTRNISMVQPRSPLSSSSDLAEQRLNGKLKH
jgi:hypothetical protein